MTEPRLTAEMLLRGYANGIFPMAEHRDDPDLFWVDPQDRGIFPLDGFHISRSLKRRMRSGKFTATTDRAFADVIEGCGNRDETWINPALYRLYLEIFDLGHGHSVEIWESDDLVGGVFGLCLGGAFFGESMFSRQTDASKAALVWLVDVLVRQGFELFDTQFLTPHLARLGAVEIPRDDYRRRLTSALRSNAKFPSTGVLDSSQVVVQRMTQTS